MNRDENRATAALEHPTAEELVGYGEKTLDPETERRVHRHLKRCRQCRELVRDLAAYPEVEPPGDAYRVGENEMRSTLGTLRARLLDPRERARFLPSAAAPDPERAKLLPFPPRRGTAARRSWAGRWPHAAVAAVLLLALGWGFRGQLEIGNLNRRLAEAEASLRRPRANAEVVKLLPTDNPLRSPEGSGIAPGEAGVTVVLEPDELLPPRVFAAEIRRLDGETVLRIEGLEPRPMGITFYLPPESLPAGEYRVWLIGDDAEVWPKTFELLITG